MQNLRKASLLKWGGESVCGGQERRKDTQGPSQVMSPLFSLRWVVSMLGLMVFIVLSTHTYFVNFFCIFSILIEAILSPKFC